MAIGARLDESDATHMNIPEYNDECSRCQRTVMWRMMLAIGAMFGAIGITLIIRYNNAAVGDILGPIILALVGFPIMLLGFVHADRAYQKFSSLICPHCDGSLAREKSIIIATGNCPTCGRRVLSDSSIGT